jgi:hypothetical protein
MSGVSRRSWRVFAAFLISPAAVVPGVANPREGGDTAAVLVYGGRVTDTPEPTLAAVLAAVQALAADVAVIKAAQVETRFAAAQNAADIGAMRDSWAKTHSAVSAGFAAVQRDVERLRTDEAAHVEQVRADVAGVKADTAIAERYGADLHEALVRHITDPRAHRNAA